MERRATPLIEVFFEAIEDLDRSGFFAFLPEEYTLFVGLILPLFHRLSFRLRKGLCQFLEAQLVLCLDLFKFPQNVKMLGMIIHNLLNKCIDLGMCRPL